MVTKIEECASALQEYCRKSNFPYQPTKDQAVDLLRPVFRKLMGVTPGMYDAYRCDDLWRELNSKKVWDLWVEAALREDINGQTGTR